MAYSLGDFFGDAVRGGSNCSIIPDLEITKDTYTGSTRVTDWSCTLTGPECGGCRRVVRIREAIAARGGSFVDKVTADRCASMKYVHYRPIEGRITGCPQPFPRKSTLF